LAWLLLLLLLLCWVLVLQVMFRFSYLITINMFRLLYFVATKLFAGQQRLGSSRRVTAKLTAENGLTCRSFNNAKYWLKGLFQSQTERPCLSAVVHLTCYAFPPSMSGRSASLARFMACNR
jgi:hypothetical protein